MAPERGPHAFGFWVLGVGFPHIPYCTAIALSYGVNTALIYLQWSPVVPIPGWEIDVPPCKGPKSPVELVACRLSAAFSRGHGFNPEATGLGFRVCGLGWFTLRLLLLILESMQVPRIPSFPCFPRCTVLGIMQAASMSCFWGLLCYLGTTQKRSHIQSLGGTHLWRACAHMSYGLKNSYLLNKLYNVYNGQLYHPLNNQLFRS